MENVNIKGINEVEIDSITLSLYNYVEKIKAIFNNLDSIVDDTSTNFVGSDGDHFRAKYNLFRDNYQIVYDNITLYADALKKAQMVVTDFDKELSSKVESNTSSADLLRTINITSDVNIDVMKEVK